MERYCQANQALGAHRIAAPNIAMRSWVRDLARVAGIDVAGVVVADKIKAGPLRWAPAFRATSVAPLPEDDRGPLACSGSRPFPPPGSAPYRRSWHEQSWRRSARVRGIPSPLHGSLRLPPDHP